MRWPRATLVEYSRDRRMYRVGAWYLGNRERVEVMIAGRWVPGIVLQSPINPDRWYVQVPVDRLGADFNMEVVLTSGLRIRPPRERAAGAALER